MKQNFNEELKKVTDWQKANQLNKEDFESNAPEQFNGDKFLSKEDWLKQKKAEILWGQAANIACEMDAKCFEVNENKNAFMANDGLRKAIFSWLWTTKDDFKKLI